MGPGGKALPEGQEDDAVKAAELQGLPMLEQSLCFALHYPTTLRRLLFSCRVFGARARRLRCKPDSTSRTSPGVGASHLELLRATIPTPPLSLRRRRWRSTKWYIAQRQLTPLNKGGLDMTEAMTPSILSLVASIRLAVGNSG